MHARATELLAGHRARLRPPQPDRPSTRVAGALPPTAVAGARQVVRVMLTNLAIVPLRSVGEEPVQLGSRWLDERADVVAEGPRARLEAGLWPRTSRSINLPLDAPAQPGRYELRVAPVRENVAWFDDVDARNGLRATCDVVAPASGGDPADPSTRDDPQLRQAPDIVRPRGLHRLYRSQAVRRLAARHFHRAYYYAMEDTLFGSHWLGTPTVKLASDLWSYQEILTELRPALLVETGTFQGGSARYLASVMDMLGTGRIISIDIQHPFELPRHPRVEYVLGSSVDPAVVGGVTAAAADGPVIVILDSDHSRDHVLAELRAYADIVTPGSYCIVEDTNVNNHPVLPHWGPGPMEAVDAFLAERDDFEIDPWRERFMLTMNPRGYLRRRA